MRRNLQSLLSGSFAPFSYLATASRISAKSEIKQLGRALWAGFGTTAANRLKAIQTNKRFVFSEEAAWALACWHHSRGEFGEAVEQLARIRAATEIVNYDPQYIALEVDSLIECGQIGAANALLQDCVEHRGELPILCFSAANVLGLSGHGSRVQTDKMKLAWINKPFLAADFAPIELRDSTQPLKFENIVSHAKRHENAFEKISVLMPAHNSETTIGIAIESILSQSWANLELIVVDDASCDGTWSVIEAYAARDSRIRAIRHSANRGAYAARNTALSNASGEFITVSDADDWSHPQRFELQAQQLLQTGLPCNTTSSIRVDFDLRILITLRAVVIRESLPSLMVRRRHVLELGGWDEAKMSADAEFYARLLTHHRQNKTWTMRETPLTLQLGRPTSLTSNSDTGLATLRYGARREYVEAYKHWHNLEAERPGGSRLIVEAKERPFPVPAICRPTSKQELQYDLLFVSDFARKGSASSCATAMLQAAKESGFRSACIHWPSLSSAGNMIDVQVRQAIHDGIVESVVAGETVHCDIAIVNDASILEILPDTLPRIKTNKLLVVLNKLQGRNGRAQRQAIHRLLQNAERAFGAAPILAPASYMMRLHLLSLAPELTLADQDWVPLVDRDSCCELDRVTQGRGKPAIGYQIFASRTQQHMRYSQARPPVIGGEQGPNGDCLWVHAPPDAATENLREVDFFVYCCDDSKNEIPYNVLVAMSLKIPVLLPRHFEPVFSAAALYPDPADIVEAIDKLWRDEDAYRTQTEAGQRYLNEHCSTVKFQERLAAYTSSSKRCIPYEIDPMK